MIDERRELFNPVILFMLTVFVVSGIISGVFSAKCNTEAQEIIKNAELFTSDFREAVKSGFWSEIFWVALSALGGMNVFLTPITFGAAFVKGYIYGFTSGCILASFGFHGYCLTLSGLFIHNFLNLVILAFYGTYAVNKSAGSYLNRRNYDYRQRKNREYIKVTLCVIVITLATAFFEGAISSFVYEI